MFTECDGEGERVRERRALTFNDTPRHSTLEVIIPNTMRVATFDPPRLPVEKGGSRAGCKVESQVAAVSGVASRQKAGNHDERAANEQSGSGTEAEAGLAWE